MTSTWTNRTVAVSGLACLLVAATTLPAQGARDRVVRGDFAPAAAAAEQAPYLSGRAQVVRTGGGKTLLSVHVKGLEPGATYGVHLHELACKDLKGHYKHSPSGAAAPPNELWASSDAHDAAAGITANSAGNANGKGAASWTARPSARSVAIHVSTDDGGTTAGGPRLVCADLR